MCLLVPVPIHDLMMSSNPPWRNLSTSSPSPLWPVGHVAVCPPTAHRARSARPGGAVSSEIMPAGVQPADTSRSLRFLTGAQHIVAGFYSLQPAQLKLGFPAFFLRLALKNGGSHCSTTPSTFVSLSSNAASNCCTTASTPSVHPKRPTRSTRELTFPS